MSDGGPTTESTLIFAFLVAFLGIFALGVTGGILWPRIRQSLAERFGIFQTREEVALAQLGHLPMPQLWDPLALRLSSADGSGSSGTSKYGKRGKWKSRCLVWKRRTKDPAPPEATIEHDVRDGSVAVVIAMPSYSQASHTTTTTTSDEPRYGEYALGLAQVRCSGSGQDPS
ncbi:hypothetical protein GSI_14451 [Ganoderma sinense ZZ0214-1]|uniref:Uncharacterized protein n=1 Tax=Ganoderma sinense ZZ0214-1 TaxID=1077348 RepID=A0A2G8RNP8_9APHY|nr:hypothetical protein GSI_14451 [Ganoderma sinense ZZ0214-1]